MRSMNISRNLVFAVAAVLVVAGCNRSKSGESASAGTTPASVDTKKSTASKNTDTRPSFPVSSGGFFDVLKPSEAHAQPGGDAWTPDAPAVLAPEVVQRITTALEDRISRPGVSIEVRNFRKSSVKNLLVGDAVLGARGQSIMQPIYASTDGRWVTLSGMYQLGAVKESDIPGFRTVTFEKLGNQDDEEKTQTFLVSESGQFISFSEWTDTTLDPRVERMKMVSLDHAPRQGAKNGKVTIVEFSDFQCPYCDRAAKTMRGEVYPEYKDRVTFYFKQLPLPFHKWADTAAIAALCVKRDSGDDAFWKLYNFYFENQSSLNESNLKDRTYKFAKTLGLNESKFKGCVENRETQKLLEKDMEEANALGITGTPGFLVNGKKLSGAQPYTAFKAEIEAALKGR